MSTNELLHYYQVQTGNGKPEFGPTYFTPRFVQHGRGFANFFSAIYQYLKPIITSGLGALKNTAIKTGSSALSEIGSRPFKEILLDYGNKAKNDLQQKFKEKFQEGQGLFTFAKAKNSINKRKPKTKPIKTSSKPTIEKNKNKKVKSKKLKQRILDIFSKKKN